MLLKVLVHYFVHYIVVLIPEFSSYFQITLEFSWGLSISIRYYTLMKYAQIIQITKK